MLSNILPIIVVAFLLIAANACKGAAAAPDPSPSESPGSKPSRGDASATSSNPSKGCDAGYTTFNADPGYATPDNTLRTYDVYFDMPNDVTKTFDLTCLEWKGYEDEFSLTWHGDRALNGRLVIGFDQAPQAGKTYAIGKRDADDQDHAGLFIEKTPDDGVSNQEVLYTENGGTLKLTKIPTPEDQRIDLTLDLEMIWDPLVVQDKALPDGQAESFRMEISVKAKPAPVRR